MYQINGETLATDEAGFLQDHTLWSPALAQIIAQTLNIELTEEHWPVLELLRTLYIEFDLAPANRGLVKIVGQKLGPEKGNSIYLMSLFGGSPAKDAARIAGLPKPPHCL
ncbi:MAG: TusE/DsrC/DsvC family sulfur relay protein [Natronospirillum sp.]